MRRRSLAGLALLAALVGTPAPAQRTMDEQQLVRRLELWLRHWQAGKIDLDEPIHSAAAAGRWYGEGLLAERATSAPRHIDGITGLVDEARRHESAAVTRALLGLAAVGIAGDRRDAGRAPHTLREIAHRALSGTSAPAAIASLLAATEPDERSLGVRVAATRALGGIAHGVARVYLQRRLDDAERLVRLAAAEALAARADPLSLPDLRDRLTVEADPVVLQAVAQALHRILRTHASAVPAPETSRATMAAIDALGRGDWRTDLALVELLTLARSARAIAPLIDLLERCGRDPAGAARLRDATHDLLESLTGTRLPAEDVDRWRAFWTSVKDDFVLAKVPTRRADAGATTTRGFFGIPVRGSRIEFVIDVSGSMSSPLGPIPAGTASRPAPSATRLEWAIHELQTAVDALSNEARFRVVLFANDARSWPDARIAPTRGAKRSLADMLDDLRAGGGTNLFAALDLALGIADATYGAIVPEAADEVFLLTDGFPSAGEITSTDAIVTAVREANRYRRARIHAISLGGNAAFLRQLAEENGGTFVERR